MKTWEKLDALQRRLDHLDKRIRENAKKDLSYDKAEAVALRWAIGLLTKAAEAKGIRSTK